MEAKPLRQRVIEAMNPVFIGKYGRPQLHPLIPEAERPDAFPHARDYFLKMLDGKHEVTDAAEEANKISANLESRTSRAIAAFLDFTREGYKHLTANPDDKNAREIAAKLVPLVEKTEYASIKNAQEQFVLLVGHDNLAKMMRTGLFEGPMEENVGIKQGDERTGRVLFYLNTQLKPLVLATAREMYGLKTGNANEAPKNTPRWEDVLSGKWPGEEKPAEPKKAGLIGRILAVFQRGKQ